MTDTTKRAEWDIPDQITPELACIMENCDGPEMQTGEAVAALVSGYQPTWTKIVAALRHTAPPDSGAGESTEVQSEYERGFEAGRKSWGAIIEQHKAHTAELENTILPHHGGADAGVRVKPLEWEQPDGPEGTAWLGHGTDMCQYYIRFDAETASYWMPGDVPSHDDNDHADEFFALDDAKAAAQADYERRVLSALTNQPLAVEDGEVIDREAYWRGAYERMASRNQELSNAVDSNASAEARLREALTGLQRQSNAAYCRYIDQMSKPECLGFEAKLLSGKFSKIELDAHARAGEMIGAHRALSDAVKQINEALSTHSPASDCDKHGCMGDMAPGDPKDLQELLSKPSVLEPSDRTADVTQRELAEWLFSQRGVYRSDDVASALLDAFTVRRR